MKKTYICPVAKVVTVATLSSTLTTTSGINPGEGPDIGSGGQTNSTTNPLDAKFNGFWEDEEEEVTLWDSL